MGKIVEILMDIRPEYDWEHADDFIANGMLDSFDIIVLVSELESAYPVSVDGSDILAENFSSLESIADLVRKSGGIV